MKRSEIIRKVAETVKPILNNDLTSDIGLTSHGAEQLVNIVLAALEEAGMKPVRLSEDKCQALSDIYYGGYTCNQWDEDFEKDSKAIEALERRLKAKQERESKRKNNA